MHVKEQQRLVIPIKVDSKMSICSPRHQGIAPPMNSPPNTNKKIAGQTVCNALVLLLPCYDFFIVKSNNTLSSQPFSESSTAISVNVVGSKHKGTRQDRKVYGFFLNTFIKISHALSIQ